MTSNLSRDPHCGEDVGCRRWQPCPDRQVEHAMVFDGDLGPVCDTCGLGPDDPGLIADVAAYDDRHAASRRAIDAAYLTMKGA